MLFIPCNVATGTVTESAGSTTSLYTTPGSPAVPSQGPLSPNRRRKKESRKVKTPRKKKTDKGDTSDGSSSDRPPSPPRDCRDDAVLLSPRALRTSSSGSLKKKGFNVFRPKKKISRIQKKYRKFGRGLHPDSDIPELIVQIISYLNRYAQSVEGIFRKTASVAEVNALRRDWESGKDIDWNTKPDPHVIAGLLVNYLTKFPEPVIVFDLYDPLIAATETEEEDNKGALIRKLLQTLPPCNYELLNLLLGFLSQLSQNHGVNKMTPANLGIVFGPVLMRRRSETAEQIIKDSPLVNAFMQDLIEYYPYYFQGEPRVPVVEISEDGNGEEGPEGSSVSSSSAKRLSKTKLSETEDIARDQFGQLQYRVLAVLKQLERHFMFLDLQLHEVCKAERDVILYATFLNYVMQILSSPPKSFTANTESFQAAASGKDNLKPLDDLRRDIKAIQNLLGNAKTKLEEDALFMENDEVMEVGTAIEQQLNDTTSLINLFEGSIAKHTISKRMSASTQAQRLIDAICARLLPTLKNELKDVKHSAEAVVYARVVRAIKKGLSSSHNWQDAFSEDLRKVKLVPHSSSSKPSVIEQAKFEAICDVVGYGFKEIEKLLTKIQKKIDRSSGDEKDNASKITLLICLKEFIEKFLEQDPEEVKEEEVEEDEEAEEADAAEAEGEVEEREDEEGSLVPSHRTVEHPPSPSTEPHTLKDSVGSSTPKASPVVRMRTKRSHRTVARLDRSGTFNEQLPLPQLKSSILQQIIKLKFSLNALRMELESNEVSNLALYLDLCVYQLQGFETTMFVAALTTQLKKVFPSKCQLSNAQSDHGGPKQL